MRFLLMCLMATTLPWDVWEGEKVNVHWMNLQMEGKYQYLAMGCSQGGAQQSWGISEGGLSSLPSALTLKWPVLAKIWYLPWVVIREP